MVTKTIKYKDFDGNDRTEVAYFNINDAELAELDMEVEGGFRNLLNDAEAKADTALYYKVFKIMVAKAYGVKSADGRRLMKSKEISDEFFQTNAYAELFYDVIKSEDAATEFFKGVLSGCHFAENIDA